MCNGSFDQIDRLESKNFLDRLFKCVGSECVGLVDQQLEFLRVLKEGCARDGFVLGDDVAPRGFGGLGVCMYLLFLGYALVMSEWLGVVNR